MSNKPTVKALLSDERLLEDAIGRALADQSDICELWLSYGGTLESCPHGRRIAFNDKNMPYHADAYVGPLEVAAERLNRLIPEERSGDLLRAAFDYQDAIAYARAYDVWYWLSRVATTAERCVCFLLALGEAVIGDKT